MQRTLLIMIGLLLWAGSALAVPETVSVRVTDVSPGSFSLVWMTDVAAEPTVEVYSDAGMSEDLTDSLHVQPMPDLVPSVGEAARARGIMKVRVSGLAANTTYHVHSVTVDPQDSASVSYSSLLEVVTASQVSIDHRQADGSLTHTANDLLSGRVYIRPADVSELPGQGALLVLETDGTQAPLSAFVGSGIAGPEGLLDLNNLFDLDGVSFDLLGGENTLLRIYRGGTLSTLLHYRKFPIDNGTGAVAEAVQGFFADFNLDGAVDEADFEIFKDHYRTAADDSGFNPDMNLIPLQETAVLSGDRIDARDFARFATEYGNDSVE